MEAKLELIRKLNASRTPVNYIARHLHKKFLPNKQKFWKMGLFNAFFTKNLHQQMPPTSNLKKTHANLWIRVDEGMASFRSKTVNKNRDAIIDMIELFSVPDSYIQIVLESTTSLPSTKPYLLFTLLQFLSINGLSNNAHQDIQSLLKPHFDNCHQIGMHIKPLTTVEKYAYFYFLCQNPFQSKFNIEQFVDLREKISEEKNIYSTYLCDKLVDERILQIAIRRYVKTLDIDSELQKYILFTISRCEHFAKFNALDLVLEKFIKVYKTHKGFFEDNFDISSYV